MKSAFDRSFRYTPSVRAELAKNFLRLRPEQRAMNKPVPTDASWCVNVVPIVRPAVAS